MSVTRVLPLFAAVLLGSASSSAMIAHAAAAHACSLYDADKLPASVNPASLCLTVKQAIARAAPHISYAIEIRVLTPSSLSATVTTSDGRIIPEQRIIAHDRTLTQESIVRFADSIASELARAG